MELTGDLAVFIFVIFVLNGHPRAKKVYLTKISGITMTQAKNETEIIRKSNKDAEIYSTFVVTEYL